MVPMNAPRNVLSSVSIAEMTCCDVGTVVLMFFSLLGDYADDQVSDADEDTDDGEQRSPVYAVLTRLAPRLC